MEPVLEVVGTVPPEPIPLRAVAAGVFPQGTLFLEVVVNDILLAEQRRVHEAVAPFAMDPWPYLGRDDWVPHITIAMEMTAADLAKALPLVLDRLPITGWFDHGGVEDGTTGEAWPAPQP